MWGNKKGGSVKVETLIGQSTEIRGDIVFTGGLHLDGKVVGNVIAEGKENCVLIISDRGCIEGEVRVPVVILNGIVIGDVYATERVEFSNKGRVNGNVYYNMLEMAMGAEINGSLIHCENEKKLLEHQKQSKTEVVQDLPDEAEGQIPK
ncbi:MAG: polymer-forming cytoskeletal protein [Gammaproteobacteria bacterium]|nr:polymer-forming cytoskeletal protein [Gammaproteobacteria bacterium]